MARARRAVSGTARKTSRQIAASRRNVKKAQIASARKRRGTGRGKPLTPNHSSRISRIGSHVSRNRGKYGAAVGIISAAGIYYGSKTYVAHNKRSAMRSARATAAARVAKRNKMVTLYHVTHGSSARSIVRSQSMYSKTRMKPGDAGDENHVWFGTKEAARALMGSNGMHMVTVRVRRGDYERFSNAAGRFNRPGGMWVAVPISQLHRYKIRGPR